MKLLLYFVTGHGYGHAVRSAQVVRALYGLGVRCEILTAAPRFIFDVNLKGIPFGYRAIEGDPGVAQVDSLKNDIPATLEQWNAYLSSAEIWMGSRRALCRELKPAAIAADVTPLAFPLAAQIGVPSFLVGTFTWDWILEFYRDENPAFGEVAARVREWYLMAGNMITTPFAYGLPGIRPAHTVPLIGKRATMGKAALRNKFGLDARPAFFISFGGCGANDIGNMGIEKLGRYQFVFLSGAPRREGNVAVFSDAIAAHEELVAACDAVITKPGYGICAECALNRTAMVYTSRGKFAEYEPLTQEMQRHFPAVYIPQEDLFGGRLGGYLENIPPFAPHHIADAGTGAREAARIIAEAI